MSAADRTSHGTTEHASRAADPARPGGFETTTPSSETATGQPAQIEHSSKLIAIRLLNYMTNHIVCHIPSFALRHAWYRSVLGIKLGEHAGIHLGCYVWFYGPNQLRRDGLEIGAYSRINRNCCLDARCSLRIGSNVSISPEVMLLTASHDSADSSFPLVNRPLVIEDYVWIGSRATVLPGVTLGRGCIVAAGAVVTRDVAPLEIVAGVPARKVGMRPSEATNYLLDSPFPLYE
jgi:maltose O-acetyltransferase